MIPLWSVSFSSREKANKAARANLLCEWDEDCFESYEVHKDNNGLVIVTADCPDGEVRTVRVR